MNLAYRICEIAMETPARPAVAGPLRPQRRRGSPEQTQTVGKQDVNVGMMFKLMRLLD